MGPGEDHRRRPRAAARPRLQPLTGPPRRALVPAQRARGWVERFAEGHGGLVAVTGTGAPDGGAGAVLRGRDGALARWELPGVDLEPAAAASSPEHLAPLLDAVGSTRTHAVLLVRRGGGVPGVVRTGADGSEVLAAVVRTAYVQSRTAAGGWSQQRYARRRAGQAAGLAQDVATAAARVWAEHRPDLTAAGATLCTAGDRDLLALVLESLPGSASWVADRPRAGLELREDPRRRSLDRLADDVGALRVTVTDPA